MSEQLPLLVEVVLSESPSAVHEYGDCQAVLGDQILVRRSTSPMKESAKVLRRLGYSNDCRVDFRWTGASAPCCRHVIDHLAGGPL